MSTSFEGKPTTNLSQQLGELENTGTMDDIMNALDAELIINREKMYTDTLACDAPKIKLNPLLTSKEAEDAKWWYKYLDHELMLITAPIREGKGTIGGWIAKKANWYYGKTILLDFMPRELFDLQYIPSYYDEQYNNPHDPRLVKRTKYVLFDMKLFISQIARMGDVALGKLATEADPDTIKLSKAQVDEFARLTGAWVSQSGNVWLRDGVLELDEIKQYHPKRNQLNPRGTLLLYLYDQLGHMHLSVIGMTPDKNVLDDNQFLPKVTVEIKVHKSEKNQYTHYGEMYKSLWVTALGKSELRPVKHLVVDGREPWPLLGNYYYGELAQDIDRGHYDTKTDLRTTPYIMLKDTKVNQPDGLRPINGVAWIENEYVGYALATDSEGYSYVVDELEGLIRGANEGIPNAILCVQRRMNWRENHCEPSEHRKGSVVYSGWGVYDIFDSENARGMPVSKSLLKK
jgi:hypothetical protein